MRARKHSSVLAIVFLSSALVLYGTCAEVAGQNAQRGFSSRGVNRVGGPRTAVTPRMSRPTGGTSVLSNRGVVNPGGPLQVDLAPYMNGPVVIFDSPMLNANGDGTLQTDLGLESGPSLPATRPSIRPRLDLADRDVLSSKGVLGRIRDKVLQQIAQCPERPFSPEWHAAHPDVAPVATVGGNPWASSNWSDVAAWVGVHEEPARYDFRPDRFGLIFVYHNGVQEGRAVDARGAAEALASLAAPAAGASPGLSLGVFAAVPPVDKPVRSLVHLVLAASGAVSGYQYDLATGSAQPLLGALDHATQRVAWQTGSDVTEAGLANLADEAARALVFRADGWTQPWILMRVPELVTVEAK